MTLPIVRYAVTNFSKKPILPWFVFIAISNLIWAIAFGACAIQKLHRMSAHIAKNAPVRLKFVVATLVAMFYLSRMNRYYELLANKFATTNYSENS